MKSNRNTQVFNICLGGIIAAIYVALTVLVGTFGLANGAIQLRISEALCVLPLFTVAAVPGLTVGCLLSNLILGGVWQDIVFGTIATLIGAVGTYLLGAFARKGIGFLRHLWFIPPIISNSLIVPFVIYYGYADHTYALYLLIPFAAVGEILSAGVIGSTLLPVFDRIFKRYGSPKRKD